MIGCLFCPDQKMGWEEVKALATSIGPLLNEEAPFCIWVELASPILPCLPAGLQFGAARTQWAAWIAARDQKGIAAPGKEAEIVAEVDLHEIELMPETRRRLGWLGVRLLGELTKLPEGSLSELFGEEGRRLEALAWGLDPEMVPSDPQIPEIVVELEFEGGEEGGPFFWEKMKEGITSIVGLLRERGEACRTLEVTLEAVERGKRVFSLKWNTPADGEEQVWKAVLGRLQREPWTFAPERVTLRPLSVFHTRSQQLSWLQQSKRGLSHLVSLQQRGFLEGIMRVVWDDPQAPVPDEAAHLEGLLDAAWRQPLCVPRELTVQETGSGEVGAIQTTSGWSSVTYVGSRWEVEMRWWQTPALWRHYCIAQTERLGPVRLFREPSTGRWFRH
jgi:hypothetical protein